MIRRHFLNIVTAAVAASWVPADANNEGLCFVPDGWKFTPLSTLGDPLGAVLEYDYTHHGLTMHVKAIVSTDRAQRLLDALCIAAHDARDLAELLGFRADVHVTNLEIRFGDG